MYWIVDYENFSFNVLLKSAYAEHVARVLSNGAIAHQICRRWATGVDSI